MNTLSKQYTARFFDTPADYLAFRKHWSQIVNSDRKNDLTAAHHLLYLVLSGKDWRKAFTFPTNPNKINNHYIPGLYDALDDFFSTYRSASLLEPFDSLVSEEALKEARRLIAHVYQTNKLVDANNHWLVDAYDVKELAAEDK